MDKRTKRIIVIVSALFVFFFYGLGFMVNFQPDIYCNIANPMSNVEGQLWRSGRWLNALIYWILRVHVESYITYYYIALPVALMLMFASLYRYGILLCTEISKVSKIESPYISITICLVSCITVANMFSTEFFLYPDTMVMYALAILLCVESAQLYVDYMHRGQKKNFIVIIFLLILCVSMIETTAGLFIILTVPFIVAYSSEFTVFLKNQIIAGILYSIPVLLKTVFTVYVISSPRATFNQDGLIKSAANYSPSGVSPEQYIFDRITFGMWCFVILTAFLALYLSVRAIVEVRYLEIIKGVYIAFVTVFVGFMPYIFKLTNDYKPRIYYPVGALIGVLIVYGILKGLIILHSRSGLIYVATSLCVLVSVQWLSFVQMYVDQYITNYEDKYISRVIGEAIDEYESSTGNTISTVVFYSDAVRTKYSMGEGWCITQRAYDASWSKMAVLNYYLGKEYIEGQQDPKIAEYYISQNWDIFSYDQISFDGDIINICTY